MPALGRLAGDLELEWAGFGRALYVLDDVALGGGRFAGFGRAVGVLDFGAVRGAGRLTGFGRAVGVLDFGAVRGAGRLTGFGRARGGVDLGDGLEIVGRSRVCRGRAILR